MEAILSKEGGGYDLYKIDEDGKRVTFASTQDYKQKLSLKNCQAIERGYDLDELIEEVYPTPIFGLSIERKRERASFKAGFQKALELLGDKKFSEDEMIGYYEWHKEQGYVSHKSSDMVEYTQSLQQTEWEIEIEMCIEYTEGGYPVRSNTPKLDADGCLILKRK